MDGRDSDHHLSGRAVRIRDEFRVRRQGVRIHLGDHKGHIGIHAEGGGVVDDHAATLRGLSAPHLADAAHPLGTREERHAACGESILTQGLNGDLLPVQGLGPSCPGEDARGVNG